jgi:hypothetical protein
MHIQWRATAMTEDDLISTEGFELGLPSMEDMLRHECDLLQSELDVTRRDLRQAHKNLAGLICMWRDTSKELAALKADHQRITQRLSDFYAADRERETTKMGYQYGDHGKRP